MIAGLILVGVAAAFGGQSKQAADPWFLASAGTASVITSTTSRTALVARFGDDNVVDADIELGEGFTQPGTVLFPGVPEKQLEILWKDDSRQAPLSVRMTGGKSRWHTVFGISLGTDLMKLERLNRKPFVLAGFAWDYGGTVTSWRGGYLVRFFDSPRVIVRLSPRIPEQAALREYRSVQGDRDFSSGHPAMQKLNPTVYQIIFQFP